MVFGQLALGTRGHRAADSSSKRGDWQMNRHIFAMYSTSKRRRTVRRDVSHRRAEVEVVGEEKEQIALC